MELIDEVIVRQKMHGGHVAIENPRGSDIWQHGIMKRWCDDPSMSVVDFDMCAHNLRSHDGEEPLRKPMRVLASHPEFEKELGKTCPGHESHRKIQGVETAHSATYPTDFGSAVVKVVEALRVQSAFVQEHVKKAEEEHEKADDKTGGGDVYFKGTVNGKIAGALRRLHQNLGHPPNRELAKHLRLGGANKEIIDATSQIRCKACEKCVRPPLHPVAKPAALLDFNECVAVDIIYIDTNESVGHLALNMVDVGSSYQVVAPLRNRKSETVCRVFMKYWVNWAGPPGRLVLDLDTAFADSFADLTSDQAISLRAAAGQAHWQNGVAERYGASWKNCWEKLCVSEDVQDSDMIDAICAVNDARNCLRNRSGFSPRQWVFGSNGRLVPDLEDGGHELSALHAASPEGRMARQHALRNGARQAFFQCQSGESISRALAHKNRVKPREYKPGDMAYIYRQDKRKGKQNSWMWIGPAAIIGAEGSNYWLARGGRCILAAAEHLRPAEHDEVSEALRIKAALHEAQSLLDADFSEFVEAEEIQSDPGGGIEVSAEPEVEMPGAEEDPIIGKTGGAKRKQLEAREEVLKKAARQNRSLDDVPIAMRPQQASSSSTGSVAMVTEEAFMIKQPKTLEGIEKALEKEIPWKMIPEEDRPLYVEAEKKQWDEHIDFKAVRPLSLEESRRVRREVNSERILSSRFLCKDKNYAKRKLDKAVPCKAKARLCVGGQRDPDLGRADIDVDAPTANRHSLLLGLQVSLMRSWSICIGDIRAAFLNGVEAPRQLFFRQPVRGIPGLHPEQLIEIVKGVFGLSTSPKLWWMRLSQELTSIKIVMDGQTYGIVHNTIDPCAFQVVREGELCAQKRVCGMIFTHVDDLMVMSEPQLQGPIKEAIQKKFPVDDWEQDKFEYVGCEYVVKPDEIFINQTAYVQARLSKVKIPAHESEEELVDADTLEQNRSVIGCLSWLAKQTRPDIQFMVAQAQRAQSRPTVADVKWTNAAVDIAKKFQDKGIYLKPIAESDVCVFGFHDAAWANVAFEQEEAADQVWDTNCKKASQLASLVMIGDRRCLSNTHGNVSLVDWRSLHLESADRPLQVKPWHVEKLWRLAST